MKSINCSRVLFLACVMFVVGVGVGCQQKVDDSTVATDTAAPDVGQPDEGPAPDVDQPYDPATPCESHQDCNDEVDCTQDFCELSTATCQHIPLNAMCPSDDNVCTRNICYSGVGCMVGVEEQNGQSCNSGDACAAEASCQSGACQVTSYKSCDDGNECTNDSCEAALGCVFTANSNPCNDFSDYTTNDTCFSGICKGAGGTNCIKPSDCDDGNDCTVLACIDGVCQTNGPACDDGIACTVDSCLPGGTCKHDPQDALCSSGEWCDSGIMDIAGNGCTQCTDSSQCDDQNTCTTDICLDGQCLHHAVNAAGESSDMEACDDGDACTLESFCINGTCVGGKGEYVLNCDDGQSCTKDWCDPDFGCFNQPSASCGSSDPGPGPQSDVETCNGVDDDGDGWVDEVGADGCTNYYWDNDGDGYGKAGATCLCSATSKYVPLSGDCDDSDPSVHENCGSGGPGPDPGGDPAKFCEVRRIHNSYELNGWFTGAACQAQNADGANWCLDVLTLKVYGDGEIWANAQAKDGDPLNSGNTSWMVGDTDWSDGCTDDELVMLQGVVTLSPDCDCEAKCQGGQFGYPNLYCTVK